MTSPLFRFLRSLAFVLGKVLGLVLSLAAPLAPARALVGAEPDARFADRVAMVLIRGGDKAGFCTGLVLGPRILLTAAHCLRPLHDMAVHYRDGAGEPVIIPVDAAIADGGPPPIGARAIVTGFGAAREGDWPSGGTLRSVTLAVREPASTVLVWAADPAGRAAGACSGDSGAPIWSADGTRAIAIVAWAQAPQPRPCGGLTQGPLLAPLKGWIEETERKLKEGG